MQYGAIGTAPYTSLSCVETVQSLANGQPIRHALDCITDAESTAICFGALSRFGGRYACLEECHASWRTRRAVKVKEVMGFEILGARVFLGEHNVYTREASEEMFAIGRRWASEMQKLLDDKLIKTHPIREMGGEWDGIVRGLEMLQRGEIRGEKLVVRISSK